MSISDNIGIAMGKRADYLIHIEAEDVMQLQCYSPDLNLRKAHDVRKLERCACSGLGLSPTMIRIGAKWWHGRCAIAEHGIEKIAAMGPQAYSGLTLNDIGVDAMRRLVNNSN